MRFNPPPNWPPAPPGWVPDGNWAPDPSWPDPPPGWQLWIDDSAQYPASGAAPQYPAPWLPSQQPGHGSRKALWIALAAAAVVAVLVAGLLVSFRGRLPAAEKPSRKPDITSLTSNVLVERSVFPDPSGGKWISGVNSEGGAASDMPNLTIDPPECADLYGDPKAASQTATATLAKLQAGGLHSMRVRLAITPDQHNIKGNLAKCQSFTQTFEASGRTVTTDVRLDPLDVAGVPPWAVATVMSSSSSSVIRLPMSVTATTVSGYYRGVLVVASSNDIRLRSKKGASVDVGTADDLVKLFNAQIEKLEAAP